MINGLYDLSIHVSLIITFYTILMYYIKIHSCDSYDQNKIYGSIKINLKGKDQNSKDQNKNST